MSYRARSLDRTGAYAAFIVGVIIFGLGGWQWAVLLLTFFITSSGLSRVFRERKREANEKFAKGVQRDAGQVLGNGGIASLFTVMHVFFPQTIWPWLGFAASLAAVNADTWATELGVLSPNRPRLITNLREVVDKGTSGGVSLVGTLASLAGATLIGALAGLLAPGGNKFIIFIWISVAGFFGALFDSFLGATVQAIYYCHTCKKDTEQNPFHTCGSNTSQLRGWEWLNNDLVNFSCGAVGGLIVVLLIIFQ